MLRPRCVPVGSPIHKVGAGCYGLANPSITSQGLQIAFNFSCPISALDSPDSGRYPFNVKPAEESAMGFQTKVNIDLPKPSPQQWNGEQDCQKCGTKLAWNNGTSVCGHVRHYPSWEEQANGVLADLARCDPGDPLSAGLLDRARSLVRNVSVQEWARNSSR